MFVNVRHTFDNPSLTYKYNSDRTKSQSLYYVTMTVKWQRSTYHILVRSRRGSFDLINKALALSPETLNVNLQLYTTKEQLVIKLSDYNNKQCKELCIGNKIHTTNKAILIAEPLSKSFLLKHIEQAVKWLYPYLTTSHLPASGSRIEFHNGFGLVPP